MSNIPVFEHLKACAEAAKDYAGGLVAELAQAVMGAVGELASDKADKGERIPITILTTGWGRDEQQEVAPDIEGGAEVGGQPETVYPYWYDIPMEGITAKDRADINFGPAVIEEAASYGICPASDTKAGKVRIRSVTIPQNALAAEIWIHKGKE